MSTKDIQISMLEKVADALGPLRDEVVFVGGCTTGLFLDDPFTLEQVRFTDDVDLIVNVTSYSGFNRLTERLRPLGFTTSMDNDVICRLNLGELKVDFMPVDGNALGFSNRWYQLAIETAEIFHLSETLTIKLVSPVLFIATKLEAYRGRGKGDALASHDIEDLLNIFDGRPAIVDELKQAQPDELKSYIKNEISTLLKDINFEYAVQTTAQNNPNREKLIFQRLEDVADD